MTNPDSPTEPKPSDPDADPIAAAVDALKQAAETLADTAAAPGASQRPPPESHEDEERRRYYDHLEERGALVDVDEKTDLSDLPPEVTHVRYPDGRVRRIGYLD
jgi:hypothetical protein